jgi:hypothetical protein
MDRPNRIPQIYGYGVCIIAIITFLIGASSIVENLFDLANPLQASRGFGGDGSLTSFEAYKATRGRAEPRPPARAGEAPADTLSDAALRRQYEALRADRIESTRYRAQRSLVNAVLLVILAAALFAVHWRWLQRFRAVEHAGDPAASG